MYIFFTESYFLRVNSILLTTIVLDFTKKNIKINVITGGGTGSSGFTYGAEKSIVNEIIKILIDYCEKNYIEYLVSEIKERMNPKNYFWEENIILYDD